MTSVETLLEICEKGTPKDLDRCFLPHYDVRHIIAAVKGKNSDCIRFMTERVRFLRPEWAPFILTAIDSGDVDAVRVVLPAIYPDLQQTVFLKIWPAVRRAVFRGDMEMTKAIFAISWFRLHLPMSSWCAMVLMCEDTDAAIVIADAYRVDLRCSMRIFINENRGIFQEPEPPFNYRVTRCANASESLRAFLNGGKPGPVLYSGRLSATWIMWLVKNYVISYFDAFRTLVFMDCAEDVKQLLLPLDAFSKTQVVKPHWLIKVVARNMLDTAKVLLPCIRQQELVHQSISNKWDTLGTDEAVAWIVAATPNIEPKWPAQILDAAANGRFLRRSHFLLAVATLAAAPVKPISKPVSKRQK